MKPASIFSHIEIHLSIRLKLTLIMKNNLTDSKYVWIVPSRVTDMELQRSIFVSGQEIHITHIFPNTFVFLWDDSVTTHITSSLLHKVREVLQQEICFIKSNNWLTRFPSSPEFHTGGLNIPHMQRNSPCKAFAACLKIRAVNSKGGLRIFFQIGSDGFLVKSVFAFLWLCLTAMNFQMETWQAVSWQRLLPQHT